jgi:hypothetical protein
MLDSHNKRYRCLHDLLHPHIVKYQPEQFKGAPLCPECNNPMFYEDLARQKRFKRSSLDLVGMIRSKPWGRSHGRTIDSININESKLLSRIRDYLDVRRFKGKRLLYKRSYMRKKGSVWILAEADAK